MNLRNFLDIECSDMYRFFIDRPIDPEHLDHHVGLKLNMLRVATAEWIDKHLAHDMEAIHCRPTKLGKVIGGHSNIEYVVVAETGGGPMDECSTITWQAIRKRK